MAEQMMFAQQDPALRRRYQMAQLLQQQGTDTSPVQHWTQGLARLAQTYAGKSVGDRADADVATRQKGYQDTLAQALMAGQGGVKEWTNPDTGQIAVQGQKPGTEAMASILSGNADTAPLGMQMQMQGISEQRKLENALTLAREKQKLGMDRPATVQEWQYFNNLSPEDQKRFLIMKRQAPPTINLGGSVVAPSPMGADQPPLATMPKTVPPEQQPALKGAQAAASAAGTVEGRTAAESRIGLPQVEAEGQLMIGLVDELVNHPGFSTVVGAPGATGIPAKMGYAIPGTDAAGFMSRLQQIQGKQFLQAFESLKGGGQITQIEGEKATAAMSRLQQTGQSEAEYRQAADELKSIIKKGMERARQKAGGAAPMPAQQPAPADTPSVEYLLKKYGGR